MKRLLAALFFFAMIFGFGSVRAVADTFNFSFAGADSGSGVFTASATGTSGQFLITGISGTTDEVAIASLLGAGAFSGNDNLLFYPATGSTFLDFNGVSYALAGGSDFNLFSSGGLYVGQHGFLTSFSVTQPGAAAEPGSFLLLATGLLGAVGLVR